jgi:preprotein translocase subunit YajC
MSLQTGQIVVTQAILYGIVIAINQGSVRVSILNAAEETEQEIPLAEIAGVFTLTAGPGV